MPTNPDEPLSVVERHVFGADAVRHPITGIPLERGKGALPVKDQARNHLAVIARQEGTAAAAEVGKRLDEFEATGGGGNLRTSAARAGTTPILIKRTDAEVPVAMRLAGPVFATNEQQSNVKPEGDDAK